LEENEKMKTTETRQTTTELELSIHDGPTLLDLAKGWLKQGNTVVALELLASAAHSREAQQQPLVRAQVLKETGRALMMQSDWTNSERQYLEAQTLFIDNGDLKGAAESARNRANMSFQQGQYAEAQDLCEQALGWASILENHELRATILNTLAAIKSATGKQRDALQTFRLCLTDFQTSGNVIRQGYVLLNIGLTEMELREFTEAARDLNEALAVALSERDLHLVEICYQNISKCYLEQGETQLAKSVIDTARKILPGLNSRALEAELNLLDCRILRSIGHYAEARNLLAITLQMAQENKLSALHADTLYEQGLLDQDLGEEARAATTLRIAADEYRRLGMDNGFQQALSALEQLGGRKTKQN
jgi:tetratricopeptide (TPR) repeat protein